MIAVSTTIGHHSNGQDGCLFADEIRVPDGECVAALPSQSGPRPINKRDGSFSTNYVRVGLDYERLRLSHELSREIALERDLTTLLNKILISVFRFIRADRGVIFLKDETGELVPGSCESGVGARRGPPAG